MSNLLDPQDMNLSSTGWWFYYIGLALFTVAILCLIAAAITISAKHKTAAGTFLTIAVAALIIGGISFIINLTNGHERFRMIQDLERAGWNVLSVDEGRDAATVSIGGGQREVLLIQVGLDQTWAPFQQCRIDATTDGPEVSLASCAFAPKS